MFGRACCRLRLPSAARVLSHARLPSASVGCRWGGLAAPFSHQLRSDACGFLRLRAYSRALAFRRVWSIGCRGIPCGFLRLYAPRSPTAIFGRCRWGASTVIFGCALAPPSLASRHFGRCRWGVLTPSATRLLPPASALHWAFAALCAGRPFAEPTLRRYATPPLCIQKK